MTSNQRNRFIVPAAACLLYIWLRCWHLTDSCLWFDEIFSIHAAEHDWPGLFRFVAEDLIHPPLFYVFLKVWISIGGESLIWLRSFPVFFSGLALVPFFLLCRQFKLPVPTIVLALLFLAVNGSLIKYAQEVRMYSLLMCLSLFSLWLFARFLNVGKGIWFLTLVNILLVHTQYFGWFIVIAEVLAVLYLQRIKIGQTLIMVGLTAVSAVPWMIEVWKTAATTARASQNLGWAGRPNPSILFQFGLDLIEPFYYRASSLDALTIWPVTIPLLVIILTISGFYLAGWKMHSEKEKNAFAFLLIIILTPLVLAFVASWSLPFSIWGTRHLIVIFAPAAILLAKFFSAIENKTARFAAVGSVLVILTGALIGQIRREPATFIWCAWENLAGQVSSENSADEKKILVFDDLIAYHFWFALRNEQNFQIVKVSGIPDMTEDKAYFLPRGFSEVQRIEADTLTGDRFYIAFYAPEFNYLKQPLRFLIEKGYRFGEPQVFEAQGLKAFLVEVRR